MYRRHENIEMKLCQELDNLENRYRANAEMSEGDLKKIDMIVHALKSMATYEAMKEASEYNNQNMNSYSNNGMSGNSSYAQNSYENSYARDQMSRYQNREMGGMYPPMEPRRW